MKKIRIGNDIPIKWTINRDGQPEDFSGKTIKLLMRSMSEEGEITDYKVDGNVISWTFFGKDQTKATAYTFTLIENEGQEGMFTIDACRVLQLVECSDQADDDDGPFDVFVDTDIVLPAPGRTPVLETGETVTLGPGSKATAEVVRDGDDESGNPKYKVDFGIPRGEKGERGDKGEKGEKGEKGDTGEQGAQGPQGVAGPQGEKGEKGDKGDKGDTGAQGPSGSPGSNGATFTPAVDAEGNLSWTNDKDLDNPQTVNIKGPKGDKGDKGDTGPQGAQGIQGEPGPQGPKGDPGATPDMAPYQTKEDETLQTTDKTVVGAINELLSRIAALESPQA